MANPSTDKRAKGRRAIGRRASKIEALKKKAHAGLAEARQQLRGALKTLDMARAGSTKERKAHKAARVAMKAVIAAKKRLRKVEKKNRKRTVALKAQPKPRRTAARERPTSGTQVERKASRVSRSRPKPRRTSPTIAAKQSRAKRSLKPALKKLTVGIQPEAKDATQPKVPPPDLMQSKAIRPVPSEIPD